MKSELKIFMPVGTLGYGFSGSISGVQSRMGSMQLFLMQALPMVDP